VEIVYTRESARRSPSLPAPETMQSTQTSVDPALVTEPDAVRKISLLRWICLTGDPRLASRRAQRRTDAPPSAKTRAIPAPIVPAPMTATSRGKSTWPA
jgi:hypothetical protein